MYFTVLISHTVLAVVIVPLVIMTLYPGVAGAVAASSATGALDVPPVALRIGNRCDHLRHVVSTVIAFLAKSGG